MRRKFVRDLEQVHVLPQGCSLQECFSLSVCTHDIAVPLIDIAGRPNQHQARYRTFYARWLWKKRFHSKRLHDYMYTSD